MMPTDKAVPYTFASHKTRLNFLDWVFIVTHYQPLQMFQGDYYNVKGWSIQTNSIFDITIELRNTSQRGSLETIES
jgi:hypothetical protein